MALLLALLLSTAFPSTSRTSWMRPDAFHLTIGMPRADVMAALDKWAPKPGKDADEVIVDYSDGKSLTLQFRKDRLSSVRFELFEFLPEIPLRLRRRAHAAGRGAWKTAQGHEVDSDLRQRAAERHGRRRGRSEIATGEAGIGVLAVRYYDPR